MKYCEDCKFFFLEPEKQKKFGKCTHISAKKGDNGDMYVAPEYVDEYSYASTCRSISGDRLCGPSASFFAEKGQ